MTKEELELARIKHKQEKAERNNQRWAEREALRQERQKDVKHKLPDTSVDNVFHDMPKAKHICCCIGGENMLLASAWELVTTYIKRGDIKTRWEQMPKPVDDVRVMTIKRKMYATFLFEQLQEVINVYAPMIRDIENKHIKDNTLCDWNELRSWFNCSVFVREYMGWSANYTVTHVGKPLSDEVIADFKAKLHSLADILSNIQINTMRARVRTLL